MRRFNSPIGVLQGSRVLFSDFADGGAMWTGQGERERRLAISFETGFLERPVVNVSLSMWDFDSKNNSRMDIAAESISRQGFQMVFRTWGDSRIARVRADWLAFGPLRDDDLWDVD